MASAPSRRSGSRIAALGILAVMLFLVLAAGYTSVLIVRRQAALQQVSRYNLTWLVSQAALEVARLHGAIGAALVPGSGVDADDVQLRLEIVENRVQLFSGGEVAEFVSTSPELSSTVMQLRQVIGSISADLSQNSGSPALQRALTMVETLQPPLARLAAAANTRGGDLVAKDQHNLSSLHWVFAAILGAITLCGFGLVAALSIHNRLLAIERDRSARQNQVLKVRDEELNTQNARFDAALNNMSYALCMVDAEQRFIVCNVRFHEMFGLAAAQATPGMLARDVFMSVTAAGRYGVQMLDAIWSRQAEGAFGHASCSFVEQDDTGRALAVSQEPMGGGGWVATFEEITERRRTEAQVAYLAHHDALTGLPNRLMFLNYLTEALARPVHGATPPTILLIDLDQFKQVNDTLGHPAGDALLRAVALRLLGCVREGDLVARLGGDEFAILQTMAKQPGSAQALAARVVDDIGRPFDIDGHRILVGTSAGIAVAGGSLDTADLLVKCADIALYRAKADGRGRFRVFESAMDTEMQAQRAFEIDLRQALSEHEFELFYQPLYNVAQRRVCGFEALLRWRHPERGLVSPGIFIPVAEELGLIVPIGDWALQRACADAATWPSHLKVAVNLSPVQFQSPDLVAVVQRALLRSELPPSRLELEITESALLQDSQTVLTTLHELNGLGLRIALDDFGTGYSSLSYLRSFPFNKLKIDQSFIRDIASRTDCEAIVRSVTNLAGTLGMTTTAEGVETEEQFNRLCEVGCTELQGYLFDKPRPVADIGRWFSMTPGLVEASA